MISSEPLDNLIDTKRHHAPAVPGGRGDAAVARFQVNGVKLVGDDLAAQAVTYLVSAAGVVEMAMSEQQVGYRHVLRQNPADVFDQGAGGIATASIRAAAWPMRTK